MKRSVRVEGRVASQELISVVKIRVFLRVQIACCLRPMHAKKCPGFYNGLLLRPVDFGRLADRVECDIHAVQFLLGSHLDPPVPPIDHKRGRPKTLEGVSKPTSRWA